MACWMPTELAIFGEESMLEASRANPPDYVVLIGKDTSEFGFRFFGRDYGRRLYRWIRKHYRVVQRFGEEPFHDDGFGALILEAID